MRLDNVTRAAVGELIGSRGPEAFILEPVQGRVTGPDGTGEFAAGYLAVTSEAVVAVYIRSQVADVSDLKWLCTCPFEGARNLEVLAEGTAVTFEHGPLIYVFVALTPDDRWNALVELLVGMVKTSTSSSTPTEFS